ncbi:MAG: SDR family oxidoreductase [Bacteroidetes bacterium]|nr:SDR family oxidoreductase [Bacteroidota bacterium]
MRRVLLIGADGFIGNKLFFFLKNKGIYVEPVIKTSIAANENNKNSCTLHDIDGLLDSGPFDFCVNASGIGKVLPSFESPYIDFEAHVVNVYKILSSIKIKQPTCKFLNLSSAAVYGKASVNLLKESDSCNPESPYGMHKLYSEMVCKEFGDFFKINTCNVRIFSAYGENQRKLLFWDLWQKYLSDPQKIILHGTGDEKRDFIYIDDLVSAIYTVMLNDSFNSSVINIGNAEPVSIRKAAETFFSLMGANTEISFMHDSKIGDPSSLVSDNSIIKRYGYMQNFSFEKGLNKYIQWLQKEK